MSDQPPAPGWWKASDGNWYPPQPVAAPAPPTPSNTSKGCLIAALAVLGIFGVVVAVAAAAVFFLGNKAADKLSQLGDEIDTPATVDADNPGAEDSDKVARIGGSVDLSGFTTTVRAVSFAPELSETEQDGYLAVDVTVRNRDDDAQIASLSDWTLQFPDGHVVLAMSSGTTAFGRSLANGESELGTIYFEIGAARGDFFVIYRPDFYDADRGIWKVTTPG